MLLSEFKEKYPEKFQKLISMFENETGCNVIWHNKITGYFIYWLHQKIKYKTLICKDSNCPKFGQKFPSIGLLARHRRWHDKKYRENHSGENNHMFGKHHSKETKSLLSNIKVWPSLYY